MLRGQELHLRPQGYAYRYDFHRFIRFGMNSWSGLYLFPRLSAVGNLPSSLYTCLRHGSGRQVFSFESDLLAIRSFSEGLARYCHRTLRKIPPNLTEVPFNITEE